MNSNLVNNNTEHPNSPTDNIHPNTNPKIFKLNKNDTHKNINGRNINIYII